MKIGPKMPTLQEKNPKMDPKKRFFYSKIPQDFELLKQVPESSHQTGSFGVFQHIGTLILSQSAFLRIVPHFSMLLGFALYFCYFFLYQTQNYSKLGSALQSLTLAPS